MSVLNVGDTVLWKGGWGNDAEKEAVVEHIEVNCTGKYGTEADSVDWSEVIDRSVMVDLSNGKWAYGNQIRKK
jgi:hypothetical protein